MAAGDVKIEYGTSTEFTLTNLHATAASSTLIAGWESNEIDNTSNKYQDYLISGLLKVAAANAQIGKIEVHIVAMISDTVWPDVFDGTESEPETISSASRKAQICKLGASIDTTATNDAIYEFGPFTVASLFGGVMPPKVVVFITSDATSSGAAFAADMNIVTFQGVYHTVAAA